MTINAFLKEKKNIQHKWPQPPWSDYGAPHGRVLRKSTKRISRGWILSMPMLAISNRLTAWLLSLVTGLVLGFWPLTSDLPVSVRAKPHAVPASITQTRFNTTGKCPKGAILHEGREVEAIDSPKPKKMAWATWDLWSAGPASLWPRHRTWDRYPLSRCQCLRAKPSHETTLS